jgi:hypothetical protein
MICDHGVIQGVGCMQCIVDGLDAPHGAVPRLPGRPVASMPPDPQHELAELKRRVEALEKQVASLTARLSAVRPMPRIGA